RGLYEDAAGYLRQFLEEHPRHARASEAHYRLGVCELERGARGTAIAEFRRALRDAALPFRAECRYRLATALQQDGEHDAARRAFEELLGEVGEDHYLVAAAQFGPGECLRDLGDDAAALERFIAAAAAARDDADGSGYGFSGLYQAGFVRLRTRQHATAEKTVAAPAERYPRHAAIAELRCLGGEPRRRLRPRRARLDGRARQWRRLRRRRAARPRLVPARERRLGGGARAVPAAHAAPPAIAARAASAPRDRAPPARAGRARHR